MLGDRMIALESSCVFLEGTRQKPKIEEQMIGQPCMGGCNHCSNFLTDGKQVCFVPQYLLCTNQILWHRTRHSYENQANADRLRNQRIKANHVVKKYYAKWRLIFSDEDDGHSIFSTRHRCESARRRTRPLLSVRVAERRCFLVTCSLS